MSKPFYIYIYKFLSALIETNPQGKMGKKTGFASDYYMNDELNCVL